MPQPFQKLREYVRKRDLDAKLRQAVPTLSASSPSSFSSSPRHLWVVWRVPQWQVQHALDIARNDPGIKRPRHSSPTAPNSSRSKTPYARP